MMKKALTLFLILCLVLPAAALAQTVPAEYVGDWAGRVEELSINLNFTIREDGSGAFTFKQNGYIDARDFTFQMEDGTFSLSPGADGSTCSGTFALENDVLTLDLETVFANGRTYGYVVKCQRVAPVQETAGALDTDGGVESENGGELRGFDSTEACAKAVTEALISGDAETFLACYAIKEMARGFDMDAYHEKRGALILGSSNLSPVNGFSIAYNEARLTNTLLMSVAGEVCCFPTRI